ncbi:hypothetical protein DASC09_010560 [Saccharomycopsis crataegensis]|uniref:Uncharacterized protein n=1 Tax=Saccharomycopsis crataegensis TaxID=43959 RepID=A0AAV5QGE4_9ASCO|nr:hypothetical protein DASC09_010560 [Saccharomycopsis crataegensis]
MKTQNYDLNALRTQVECEIAAFNSNFPFFKLKTKNGEKLSPIGLFYSISILFVNFKTAIKSANYSLEEYLSMERIDCPYDVQ